jgi:hypothetical protein
MSLEDIPVYFSGVTGVTEAVAQVILCLIITVAILFPYLVLARAKPSPMISLILVFLASCLCVGLGWAPLWILIGEALMMAMAVAFLGSNSVTGD